MKENGSVLMPFNGTVAEAILSQVDLYAKASKSCGTKLTNIWSDLGVPKEDQLKSLADALNRACNAWSDAVEEAESKRTALRVKIDDCHKESSKIKQQLGEDALDDDYQSFILSPASPKKTLNTLYEEAKEKLELWRGRRAERLEEYEAKQNEVNHLKSQLGHTIQAPARSPDISRANLDYLDMEVQKLMLIKMKRLTDISGLMLNVEGLCQEMSEDCGIIYMDIHPSLRYFRDRMENANSPKAMEKTLVQPDADVDLSDKTFANMHTKIQELKKLKDKRAADASDILDMLTKLYNALNTPREDTLRSHFTTLLTSPERLHENVLEMCLDEVKRLEQAQTQLMINLISDQVKDLQEIAESSHLLLPNLDPILSEIHSSGQASEVLQKLTRMKSELAAKAEIRQPLVERVSRIERMREESEWLKTYEADPNRFKGRNAHANLTRSIKAEKAREKLQSEVAHMRGELRDWKLHHNAPFEYDGATDYQAEVLDQLEVEVQQLIEDKQSRGKDRRQSSVGGGVTTRESSMWGSSSTRTPVKTSSVAFTPRHVTTPQSARTREGVFRPSTATTRSPFSKGLMSTSSTQSIVEHKRRTATTAAEPAPPARKTAAGRPLTPPPAMLRSTTGTRIPPPSRATTAASAKTEATTFLTKLDNLGIEDIPKKAVVDPSTTNMQEDDIISDTDISTPGGNCSQKLSFHKHHNLRVNLPR